MQLSLSHYVQAVRDKIRELCDDDDDVTDEFEDNLGFTSAADQQLVTWFNKYVLVLCFVSSLASARVLCCVSNLCSCIAVLHQRRICARPRAVSSFNLKCVCRRPEDWSLSWVSSGMIFGWGHNHRGQLGGPEGAKIKIPIPCGSLAALHPVQVVGGEQTLFVVASNGKVKV